MAITTLDGLVNAMPGQFLPYSKTIVFTATQWVSGWLLSGFPGPGLAVSAGINGEIPTDATPGPHVFNNPSAGQLTYIGRSAWSVSSPCIMTIHDRLWHNNYTTTSTALQSITQPALTRGDTNGEDVELWWMAYTVMGSGAPTLTVNYTNSLGTSGRSTSITISASSPIGRMIPIPLQAGDTGVRSVQSLQLSASHTSGTAGLVLRRRFLTIPIGVANSGIERDPFSTGMPVVPNDAAIDLSFYSTTATTATMQGEMSLLQG